ncbi:MAG: SusD/RagB family nutrient-binding outer membrane lipoprotein [Mangrovibacterium sp.]|nr:SusD/RagB family nutrient-binding outer membrane lipoprotein [Mangrovibacterium sp.]
MKKYQLIPFSFILTVLLFLMVSCEDLTKINTSSDTVNAGEIDLKYLLTSVLSASTTDYVEDHVYPGKGISEAMQYMQKDYIDYAGPNNFNWGTVSISDSYASLSNSEYMCRYYERADTENEQNFYKAAGLIMRSFWYGFFTSVWGDIPYSQAMKAEEANYAPEYDTQDAIFKGLLTDLETASELLAGVGFVGEASDADILFKGDATKWRKFANSLRLRYCMRLSGKVNEMKTLGVDVVSITRGMVENASAYPVFSSNADNAAVNYVGSNADDSWYGGSYNWSNRSEFYRRKPCRTFVKELERRMDPRLTVFIRPVDVQILVRDDAGPGYVKNSENLIKRHISSATYHSEEFVDTSRYVGLPVAMSDPNYYNLYKSVDISAINKLDPSIYIDNAANPHVSYLADKYMMNAHSLVKAVYMSYAELCFILAEARLKGWISTGTAVDYFEEGIEASLDQYAIEDGSQTVYNPLNHETVALNKNSFIAALGSQFEEAGDHGQLELLMTQKWLALFMTPEFWFDWRRTGLPDFGSKVISGNNGTKIPVRYVYGDDEKNYNTEHVNEAVSRLDTGTDTQWAKMWLLRDTGKPW